MFRLNRDVDNIKYWNVMHETPWEAAQALRSRRLRKTPRINADEAYRRYVWVRAYLCWLFRLDPAWPITGHFVLDPHRKTAPKLSLRRPPPHL